MLLQFGQKYSKEALDRSISMIRDSGELSAPLSELIEREFCANVMIGNESALERVGRPRQIRIRRCSHLCLLIIFISVSSFAERTNRPAVSYFACCVASARLVSLIRSPSSWRKLSSNFRHLSKSLSASSLLP